MLRQDADVAKHSTQAARLFFHFLDFLGCSCVVCYSGVESESDNWSGILMYWPLWIRCTSVFGSVGEEVLTVNGVCLVEGLGGIKRVAYGWDVASVDPMGGS